MVVRHLFALWLAIILLSASSLYAVFSIQSVQHSQNDGLHAVICFSENFIRHDKKLTAKQKQQDIPIYNHMLAVAHLAPCG